MDIRKLGVLEAHGELDKSPMNVGGNDSTQIKSDWMLLSDVVISRRTVFDSI